MMEVIQAIGDFFMNVFNKALMIMYVLCTLNVIRHMYAFIQAWIETTPDNPVTMDMSDREKFYLGLSLAYVISGIIMGITI